MIHQELHTDRLILRKLTQESLDYLYSELSDSELVHFLGLKNLETLEIEKAKYNVGLSTHNKKFVFFQLLEKSSNRIIGWCGFHTWYIDHSRAEIGYGLNLDSDKSKGYMSEAIVKIVNYGFTEMHLHRIEAFVATYNEPSIRLLQKLNFKQEGHLREHYFVGDKAEDSLLFSLLKSEYQCIDKSKHLT